MIIGPPNEYNYQLQIEQDIHQGITQHTTMWKTARAIAILARLFQQTATADTVTFHSSAIKVLCPTTTNTPTKLSGLPGAGVEYLLINPTSSEGELCILNRVNREVKKVYIPIARSYDASSWHRLEGKYITDTTVVCGNAASDGTGYNSGDYLCQVQVPSLGEGNDGYYLTSYSVVGVSDKIKAARFLERATWGAR